MLQHCVYACIVLFMMGHETAREVFFSFNLIFKKKSVESVNTSIFIILGFEPTFSDFSQSFQFYNFKILWQFLGYKLLKNNQN